MLLLSASSWLTAAKGSLCCFTVGRGWFQHERRRSFSPLIVLATLLESHLWLDLFLPILRLKEEQSALDAPKENPLMKSPDPGGIKGHSSPLMCLRSAGGHVKHGHGRPVFLPLKPGTLANGRWCGGLCRTKPDLQPTLTTQPHVLYLFFLIVPCNHSNPLLCADLCSSCLHMAAGERDHVMLLLHHLGAYPAM